MTIPGLGESNPLPSANNILHGNLTSVTESGIAVHKLKVIKVVLSLPQKYRSTYARTEMSSFAMLMGHCSSGGSAQTSSNDSVDHSESAWKAFCSVNTTRSLDGQGPAGVPAA